jgi:hypothetical protein
MALSPGLCAIRPWNWYRLYMFGGMSLDRPFPHRRALPGGSSGDGKDSVSREVDERNDPQVAGSMRIFHSGCTIYNVLVITGKERGHVWCDSRAEGRGIFPERAPNCSGRLTFGRWYLDLLDRLLEWHGIAFDTR